MSTISRKPGLESKREYRRPIAKNALELRFLKAIIGLNHYAQIANDIEPVESVPVKLSPPDWSSLEPLYSSVERQRFKGLAATIREEIGVPKRYVYSTSSGTQNVQKLLWDTANLHDDKVEPVGIVFYGYYNEEIDADDDDDDDDDDSLTSLVYLFAQDPSLSYAAVLINSICRLTYNNYSSIPLGLSTTAMWTQLMQLCMHYKLSITSARNLISYCQLSDAAIVLDEYLTIHRLYPKLQNA